MFLNIPEDQTVWNDAGKNYTNATWIEPIGIDNSGIVSKSSDFQPGDQFFFGETIVTYILTDPSGNMATMSFSITVIGMLFSIGVLICCLMPRAYLLQSNKPACTE